MQLEQMCIDVVHPSDLYAFEEVPGGAHCRVIYHVVGRLLSGADVWQEEPDSSSTLIYHPFEHASSTWLAVIPCSQTWDVHPNVEDISRDDLLQIDFRLYVPLAEHLDPSASGA